MSKNQLFQNSLNQLLHIHMDMQDNHHFLQPLLPSSSTTTTTTTTTTSSSTAVLPLEDHELNNTSTNSQQVIFRLALVFFIGMVSIWANHESSKGFAITIINESGNTIPGNLFQLFYVSNDEASRILIKASNTIENYLYPNNNINISHTKKQINHIILKLTNQNLTNNVHVKSIQDHEFVLYVSSSIMEGTNFNHDMSIAILRGMAHIWVWDNAPKNLIYGIVEYIATKLGDLDKVEPREQAAGAPCWNDEDLKVVAGFLECCENRWPGFIRRLNQAMKDDWHDEKLGMELGLCTLFYDQGRYNISSA